MTRPHVLFILSDQQRSMPEFEINELQLLRNFNVRFDHHVINSIMCSSSRATLFTGLHTYEHKIFENVNLPFVRSLDPNIATVGHKAKIHGYKTAYFGKVHLTKGNVTPEVMKQYGFDVFQKWGDVLGEPQDGFKYDKKIVSTAIEWVLSLDPSDSQPWFICLSLINPHDIAFFSENPSSTLAGTMTEPHTQRYSRKWPSYQDLTKINWKSKIKAHEYFEKIENSLLGTVQDWPRFQNYYLNCILAMDRLANAFVETCLDHLGRNNVKMLFTSDHGEMAGSYSLHGKGQLMFCENIHVPLYVFDGTEKRTVTSLTCHLDVEKMLISLMMSSPQLPKVIVPVRNYALFNSQLYVLMGTKNMKTKKMQTILHAATNVQGDTSSQKLINVKNAGFDRTRRAHVWGLITETVKLSCYYAPAQVKNFEDLQKAIQDNEVDWEILVTKNGLERQTVKTPSQHHINLFLQSMKSSVSDFVTVE